jgi:predicted Zn-dependent peptidase
MFDYSGPMLWTAYLTHDASTKPDDILNAIDGVMSGLQAKPVDRDLLARNLVKMRSYLYDSMTQFGGFGRANLLSCFALFDDNPARINSLEANFRSVTPELIQSTAREYLRRTNRTVLMVEPGAVKASAAGKGAAQ